MDACFCLSACLNTRVISWQENAHAPAAYLRGGFVYGGYMYKIKSQAIKALGNRAILAHNVSISEFNCLFF